MSIDKSRFIVNSSNKGAADPGMGPGGRPTVAGTGGGL